MTFALSTASVYPENTSHAFAYAARLGYDAVEVMVGIDSVSQSADRLLEGVARRGLAERAGRISQAYRAGRTSAGVVSDAADATAYVLARLPATYAADLRAFDETARVAPDFAPTSLLDAGAGPGGAGWAALETWPGIGEATLLDSNRTFLEDCEHIHITPAGAGHRRTCLVIFEKPDLLFHDLCFLECHGSSVTLHLLFKMPDHRRKISSQQVFQL